jgi:bile acid:Na+ symporter, BASS family
MAALAMLAPLSNATEPPHALRFTRTVPITRSDLRAPVIFGALAWLARHGSWLIGGCLFVGLALPDLARLCKPLIGPAVFVLLIATLLRIDWAQALVHVKRPRATAIAVAWLLLGAPFAMWLALQVITVPEGLARALVLTASSPVLTAVPTFALLLGLDATLALVAMVATSLLQPVLQPPLALALLGLELNVGIGPLMSRLALFVGGAFVAALIVRWLAGRTRIERAAAPISGVAVLMLILFGIGVVDGLTETILARPGHALVFLVAAFVANFALQVIGGIVSWLLARAGLFDRQQALTIALASGNRNLAVLVAVLGAAADADLYLFLAVNQFPMYFVPALLGPVYRRLLGAAARPGAIESWRIRG